MPAGVSTVMGPLVAAAGSVAVSSPSELTVKFAATPLTRTAVAPVKALPLIATVIPAEPEAGVNEEMVGAAPAGVGMGRAAAVAPLLGAGPSPK